tara:strand:- start:259 stop:726 length:468 start_codon:yes stop_codon:yes gene_type:complete
MSSKAMRVCDREVIERKVVDAWKQKSLHDFEKLVKSSKVDKTLNSLIKDYNSIISKMNDLETERNKLRDSIENVSKNFNKEHSFIDNNSYHKDWSGTYISTNVGSYGRSEADYNLVTQIPYEVRQAIQDELALQTMSGDFDANELIQSLINIFVK